MNTRADFRDQLEVVARILIRCFFFNLALVLIWFLFLLAVKTDGGYAFHSKFFDISRPEIEVINYCGIAIAKMCNLMFFLSPYVAIRLVLRQK